VKRTAESGRAWQSRIYQSSVSRTGAARDCLPSTAVLGYFHSSASRTEQDRTFWATRFANRLRKRPAGSAGGEETSDGDVCAPLNLRPLDDSKK